MKYLELFETQLKQIQSNFRKQDKHLVFSTRSHLIMATGVSDDCIRFRIVGQHVHEWHKENLIYAISKLNFGLRGASYIWYESEGKLFPACDYYSYFKTGDDITQKTMQIYSDIPRLEHELDSNLLALLSGDNLWATLQDPEQETGPLSLRLLHSNVDGKSEEYQEKFLNQLISECYRKKEHILSVDENTIILKRASSTESEVICALKVIKGHDILSLYVSLDGDAKHTSREMLAAITNEMNRMLDGPKFEIDLHSKTHGFVNILGINALTNPNSILPWMEESLITMQETFERLAEKHTPAGNSQKPAA